MEVLHSLTTVGAEHYVDWLVEPVLKSSYILKITCRHMVIYCVVVLLRGGSGRGISLMFSHYEYIGVNIFLLVIHIMKCFCVDKEVLHLIDIPGVAKDTVSLS